MLNISYIPGKIERAQYYAYMFGKICNHSERRDVLVKCLKNMPNLVVYNSDIYFENRDDNGRYFLKKEEDAQVEAQKQKEQQDYDNLVSNLQNVLGNFNEVVLDSTDPESDVLEIEDSDKEQVLAYLLNQDTDGKSQLVKDLENPTTLIELAWLRTQGRALIDNSTRYWKDLLKQERKEKAKLEKELESYKTRESQSVVVPKPPKSNNSNEKDIPTFGSVWDNNII